MKVIGLDLSLVGTGVVILENGIILDQKLITSKPSGKLPVKEIERIYNIREQIPADTYDLAVIEGVSYGTRNSTSLSQLSGLTYLVRVRLYLNKTPFVIVSPSSLKKFVTGRGNAQKDEMLLAVFQRWGVSFKDHNLADAYGLARVGEALLDPEIKLTKFQLEVIELLKSQL